MKDRVKRTAASQEGLQPKRCLAAAANARGAEEVEAAGRLRAVCLLQNVLRACIAARGQLYWGCEHSRRTNAYICIHEHVFFIPPPPKKRKYIDPIPLTGWTPPRAYGCWGPAAMAMAVLLGRQTRVFVDRSQQPRWRWRWWRRRGRGRRNRIGAAGWGCGPCWLLMCSRVLVRFGGGVGGYGRDLEAPHYPTHREPKAGQRTHRRCCCCCCCC